MEVCRYYQLTETGFYYLQSRYYDPIVKRFLNADSYSSTGQGFLGYNMFIYCKNNPVKFKEKAGEYSVTSFNYDYEEEDEYGTWGFSGTVYIYKGDEIKNEKYFDNPDNRPSGYVDGRDIIVLDKRNQDNPNMVVYNSYKIRDTKQQKAIISILLDYEKTSPSGWKRTSESMLTEWKWHNRFALFSDTAKHTDFDLDEEGKDGWYYINKAWEKSSIKQFIDNNPKPHWVLPVY